MRSFCKIICCLLAFVLVIGCLTCTCFAHSGRTDSRGGHKDNKNKSGLGSYHYHCGGYPAHLHTDGYCRYTDIFPSGVTINSSQTVIGIKDEIPISATVYPNNACSTRVTWDVSDTSVVKIVGDKLKAVGYGTAIITASTFNGLTSTFQITVKEIVAEQVNVSTVGEKNETVYIGDTIRIKAEIIPNNVDNPKITYQSSNPDVATVDVDGVIIAKGEGYAEITAVASNGVTGVWPITVYIKEVEEVSINDSVIEILVGAEVNINASVTPQDATFPELIWSSDNETVASVSNDGRITAHECGTAIISATASNGIYDSVVVNVDEIVAETILINCPEQIIIGDTIFLTTDFTPNNTTDQNIIWSVDDTTVAQVDEGGKLTAFRAGNIVVTAKHKTGDVFAQVSVISIPITQMTITSSVGNRLEVGEIAELVVTILPENATGRNVEWISEDPSIATVTENGVVEAVSNGRTVIRCISEDGFETTIQIVVGYADVYLGLLLGGGSAIGIGGYALSKRKHKSQVKQYKKSV